MPLRNHTRGLFANWCVASWTSLWPLLLVLLLFFVVPFSILLSLDILHSPCCEARAEFVSVCVCIYAIDSQTGSASNGCGIYG